MDGHADTHAESASELDAFRQVQRLAFDAATHVAERLEPGVTEREAAEQVSDYLSARGVRHFFHRPFAWFGDRARFAGFRTPLDFFPTDRRLLRGMSAILDVAPMVDGRTADIGYAFSLGPSTELETAMRHLRALRGNILTAVLAETSLERLYREVDTFIRDLGYENCHRRYPFGVLGHRVERTRRPALSARSLLGFGMGAGLGLLGQAAAARLGRDDGRWPFWSPGLSPEARATPGLWAIEPHLGRGEMGAKWEELLVVTPSTAYWLDDDVPHLRPRAAGAQERGAGHA